MRKPSWYRFKHLVSVGSLEETVLAKNFMIYMKRKGVTYRLPLPAETLDDYTDYLFEVMEQNTPPNRYFGTPNDKDNDVFGYWLLPDRRLK